MVQSLWRIVWRVLKKLKTDVPSDPAIAPLGLCPDENVIQRAACTPVPTAALFTAARTWRLGGSHRRYPRLPGVQTKLRVTDGAWWLCACKIYT